MTSNEDSQKTLGIKLIPVGSITDSPWRTTYIIGTDLKLLATSMHRYGWLYPVILRSEGNGETFGIVDGHERVALARNDERFLVDGKFVPAKIMDDLSDTEAMIMHVTLNRARGAVMNGKLSKTIKAIVASGAYDGSVLPQLLGMTPYEFEILMDGSLIKMRKVHNHVYSKAWIPIEAKQDEKPQFERPPNPDR